MQLTDSERKKLTEIGVMLGKQALAEVATVGRLTPYRVYHSPQSMLTDALYALQGLEAMRA